MKVTVGQRIKIPLYTELVVNVDAANIRKGPGPVVSIGWMDRVLNYAKTQTHMFDYVDE